MTHRTATTSTRAGHSPDIVRLRYIATAAEDFTTVLDDLLGRHARAMPVPDPSVISILEQAAAAAQDLAATAAIAADKISD